jgi:hypothetical protein
MPVRGDDDSDVWEVVRTHRQRPLTTGPQHGAPSLAGNIDGQEQRDEVAVHT